MKKEFTTPALEEVKISATANGQEQNFNFDGPWETVVVDGVEKHYRPGAGGDSVSL